MNSILESFRQVPFTLWLITAASLLGTVVVAGGLHRWLHPNNGLSQQAPADSPALRQLIRELLFASRYPIVLAVLVGGTHLSLRPVVRALESETGIVLSAALEKGVDILLFAWTFWVLYRIARRLALPVAGLRSKGDCSPP